MNKKGFTLIELLAVIVILAIIALIATPIILGIIRDSREASNARAVERYAKSVETAVASYNTMNPDVTDVTICTGTAAPTAASTCVVDATTAGRDNPTASVKEKVVTYSGSGVNCATAVFDAVTGKVEVNDCKVGNDTTSFSWNTGSAKGACKATSASACP